MCTIVGGYLSIKKLKDPEILNGIGRLLTNLILAKGGDYTSVISIVESGVVGIHNKDTILSINDLNNGKLFEKLELYSARYNENTLLPFMIFSRLTPEMENADPKVVQPYETISKRYVAAHGTIPIKGNYFDDIIDTEIFRYDIDLNKSIEKVQLLNGKVSMIEFNPETSEFNGVHNGLGLWASYNAEYSLSLITNIEIDGFYIEPLRFYNIKPNHTYMGLNGYLNDYNPKNPFDKKPDVIISLCSGGMDTILSTYHHIRNSMHKDDIDVDLLYFDWGTNAANNEIMSVKAFRDYLEKDKKINTDILDRRFGNVFVTAKTIDTQNIFKNVLEIADLKEVRIANPEASGLGKEEAEEAISYVPFRNTYLLLFAATYAEQRYPNKVVDFVIGANLTEGMVYLDNSTNYISKMNNLIKVAGQKTPNFNIVAPFKNVTKTKMLEKFALTYSSKKLEELVNLSFSCYFPVAGTPCNNCGSCLLKAKSMEKFKASQERDSEDNK